MNILQTPLTYLSGVGEKRARLLASELKLLTWGDLLHYYPYKHIDRTRIYRTDEIHDSMPYVQLRGRITSFREEGEGRKRRLVATFRDTYGIIELIWFQGTKYITQNYKLDQEYIIFGHPNIFNGRINITHPDIDSIDYISLSGLAFQPYYHTTEKMKRSGLNSRIIDRLIKNIFFKISSLPETLSDTVITENRLPPLFESLKAIHHPTCIEDLNLATYRIKFEELFYTQLDILRFVSDRKSKTKGLVFLRVGTYFKTFYHNHLPFELTDAQKRVIKEIHTDLKSGVQMNRLLQGDVGSGKTMVALLCSLLAADNGYQTCIMAPTEILAEQHFETFSHFLSKIGLRTEILTGSIKGKRRKAIFEALAEGTVHCLIGTHAVIEDCVRFHNLGLAIIDEQHRFGVAQRARLWDKNPNPPHVLVMTATPIPRTLAMTLYGDLEVSIIDQLPPGRKPIRTIHVFDEHRDELNSLISQEIQHGQQVYIVYPLIKESEGADMKDLENGYEHVKKTFPQFNVSKLHGKMKPADKATEMTKFASHETDILVSTTVIEVGVNVPSASVMIIENAERFGLAQLHQLRGRVGRGADQSYCCLVTKYALSQDTRRRMTIMTDTNDGFEIAEEDLKMRGPGELDGTTQSGTAFNLKLADLSRDGQLLERARTTAQNVLSNDPDHCAMENMMMWKKLASMKSVVRNWSEIS